MLSLEQTGVCVTLQEPGRLRPARALAGLLGALAAAHLALSAPALAVQPFLSSTGASLPAACRGSPPDAKAP